MCPSARLKPASSPLSRLQLVKTLSQVEKKTKKTDRQSGRQLGRTDKEQMELEPLVCDEDLPPPLSISGLHVCQLVH